MALRSYRDIPDDMVARGSQAARDRIVSPADAATAVQALERAQARQRIREGRPDAVLAAMVERDILKPQPIAPAVQAIVQRQHLPDVRWFVAHTKPAGEGQAIRSLQESGFRVCAPTVGRWHVLHRREVVKVKQLFPRYVFVGLVPDRRGDIDFRSPRLCDGVSEFIEGAGKRIEVRDTAIGDLMAASERQWLDLIWAKAAEDRQRRKTFQNENFIHTMTEILEADPISRMRMFLTQFGTRSALSEAARCCISDA